MEGLLFIILGKEPSCYHINKSDNVIRIGNDAFKAIEKDNYSGFYDWLRNEIGEVIGIRYTRLKGFQPVVKEALNGLYYAIFTHKKIIEIYFYSKRDYKAETSNDQDIGICKLYVSGNSYAILLDILYLTNDEFLSIPIKA